MTATLEQGRAQLEALLELAEQVRSVSIDTGDCWACGGGLDRPEDHDPDGDGGHEEDCPLARALGFACTAEPERKILVGAAACPACGDDYIARTTQPQPGEYDPEIGETVNEEWAWAAREGDRVTCAACDHEAQILVDGDVARVDEIEWCECAWCTEEAGG